MASLFSRIIQGEIPCHKIHEDEKYFAFLDIHPINPGHTLVIPRAEIDDLFDHEDDTLAGILVFAKRVARAIQAAVDCRRVGLMVAGLEVPHAHIHLVPIHGEGDLTFARARKAGDEELAKVAAEIRGRL